MTTRRIPPGGAGRTDGVILTRSEVTRAVLRYARRHGHYAPTVRAITVLFRAAVNEYPVRR